MEWGERKTCRTLLSPSLSLILSMVAGGQHLVRELRALTFESMLYQDMSFFDQPDHSTGSLSQILSSDVLLVKGWGGDNLGIIIQVSLFSIEICYRRR